MKPDLWAPVGLSSFISQDCLILTFILVARSLGTLGGAFS